MGVAGLLRSVSPLGDRSLLGDSGVKVTGTAGGIRMSTIARSGFALHGGF